MPCYTQQEVEQILEGIKDLQLLKEGLEEMGYSVRLIGQTLAYAGKNKLTGAYSQGSYTDGVLTSVDAYAKPDVGMIKKFVGVANLKKNAKSHKWTLKPVKGNPFAYTVQK